MERVDLAELRQRFESAKQRRAGLEPEWRDLRDYIAPDCGRVDMFTTPQVSSAHDKSRWEKIVDSTATSAAESLAAGMLGGMTSPARPWFRLTTMSPELDEQYEVKAWLSDVTEALLVVFAGSNIYEALHKAYFELAVFGTSCTVVLPSEKTVVRADTLTVGEYWLAEDDEGRVDTLFRTYTMTAKQLIQEFGRNEVPQVVRDAYDANHHQRLFTVVQAVEPRLERDPDKVDQENMPWRSVHYVDGVTEDKPLRVEGFTHFPALCPRWVTRGGNVYGTSVGMRALPLVKELSGQKVDMSFGIGYQSRPPLVIPQGFEGRENDLRPGGVIMGSGLVKGETVQSAVNVPINLQYLDSVLQRNQRTLDSLFYKDLFLMIAGSTAGNERTAFEVQQMQQEKMMMLGPVLERLHNELLGPLITATFDYCNAVGRIPPAPEAIAQQGISVNYISVLALAQKSSALNGYSTFLSTLGMAQQVMPTSNAGDLVDTDSYLRKFADMLGVDPSHLRSEKDVQKIREQREEAATQQAQMSQLQQVASAGKDMVAGAAQAQGLQNLQGY